MVLGALLLDDADAFNLVSEAMRGRGAGEDIADEIRWEVALVRSRLLNDIGPLLDQLLPDQLFSPELLEWELVVAFVTGHSQRLVALLAR